MKENISETEKKITNQILNFYLSESSSKKTYRDGIERELNLINSEINDMTRKVKTSNSEYSYYDLMLNSGKFFLDDAELSVTVIFSIIALIVASVSLFVTIYDNFSGSMKYVGVAIEIILVIAIVYFIFRTFAKSKKGMKLIEKQIAINVKKYLDSNPQIEV